MTKRVSPLTPIPQVSMELTPLPPWRERHCQSDCFALTYPTVPDSGLTIS